MNNTYTHCSLLTAENFADAEQLQETYYSFRANPQEVFLLDAGLSVADAYAKLRTVAGSGELTALRLAQNITLPAAVQVGETACSNLYETLTAIAEQNLSIAELLLLPTDNLAADIVKQTMADFAQQMIYLHLPLLLVPQAVPEILAWQKRAAEQGEALTAVVQKEMQRLQNWQAQCQTQTGKNYSLELQAKLQGIGQFAPAKTEIQLLLATDDDSKIEQVKRLCASLPNVKVALWHEGQSLTPAQLLLVDTPLSPEQAIPDMGETAAFAESLPAGAIVLPLAIAFCTTLHELFAGAGESFADATTLSPVKLEHMAIIAGKSETEGWQAGLLADAIAKAYGAEANVATIRWYTGETALLSLLQLQEKCQQAQNGQKFRETLQNLQRELCQLQKQDQLQSEQISLKQQLQQAQAEEQQYRESVKTVCRQAKAELDTDHIKACLLERWLLLQKTIPSLNEAIWENLSTDDDADELAQLAMRSLTEQQNKLLDKYDSDEELLQSYQQHMEQVLQNVWAKLRPQLDLPKLSKPQLSTTVMAAESWKQNLSERLQAAGVQLTLTADFWQDDGSGYETQTLVSPLVWSEKAEAILKEELQLLAQEQWQQQTVQLLYACETLQAAAKQAIAAMQKSCQQALLARHAKQDEQKAEIEKLDADRAAWQEFQQEQGAFGEFVQSYLREMVNC